jgi:hypothetical protein
LHHTDGGFLIVSRNFVAACSGGALSGWATFPVEVKGKKGARIDVFHGFGVLGRGGDLDYSTAKMIQRPSRWGGIQTRYTGFKYRRDAWDGSDFFYADLWRGIYLSPRAHEVLLAASLKGVEFLSLSDHEFESPQGAHGLDHFEGDSAGDK